MPMADLIEAMAGAVGEFSAGRVTQPLRTVFTIPAHEAFIGLMPAALDTPAALGAKFVTVYPHNHDRGLPSHLASIVLFDPATGALTALVDGRYITEARTAAVSAVSARLLARPDAHVLALIGSGVQARSHLDALRLVRPITDVRVWSPTPAHRERFAEEASAATGLPVRAHASAGSAAHGADLVALVSGAHVAVVDAGDIAAGAHIMAVGACRPDQREMTSALVARGRLYVDSRTGALAEAGDILLAMHDGAITEAHVIGELGDLALGRIPGRTTSGDVTIFKSLGMAVEDIVAGRLVVERARAAGLGQDIDLE
jgi:ornithine cyclodeaminase/alanine dehydrogenase-like protein (mu-crystallin family)